MTTSARRNFAIRRVSFFLVGADAHIGPGEFCRPLVCGTLWAASPTIYPLPFPSVGVAMRSNDGVVPGGDKGLPTSARNPVACIIPDFVSAKFSGRWGPKKRSYAIGRRSGRSCRGGHWPSEKLRFAETTGYVYAGRFRMTIGHPYGEDMALHRRGRCPHRPSPMPLVARGMGAKPYKPSQSARRADSSPKGRAKIHRTCGASAGRCGQRPLQRTTPSLSQNATPTKCISSFVAGMFIPHS